MIFSYSYFSVSQPCICEISQLMNNPLAIGPHTKIEEAFHRKLQLQTGEPTPPGSAGPLKARRLVILTKILNSHKNLIFYSLISKKNGFFG